MDFFFSGGFVTVKFSGVGWLTPLPTPNLEDEELNLVRPLPFDLSGTGDLTRSLPPVSIDLRVIVARKPSLHDKAVALEEVLNIITDNMVPVVAMVSILVSTVLAFW
jgi:hypothetical protein